MKATLHVSWATGLQRPPEGVTEVNVVRGGPDQLLEWLETQCGLNGPRVNHTDRIMAYHGRMRGQDGFFRRSYETDAWATAAHMLARRDALMLAGWDRAGDGFLADMARIEPMPPQVVGPPERLMAVLQALQNGFHLPPHDVIVPDRDCWPALWQRVLDALHVVDAPAPEPRGEGALRIIQQNLLAGEEATTQVDAHVVACRAGRMLAVQFLARWLRNKDATVVCSDGQTATLLDAALSAHGVPTMGASHETRAHPAMQVLPLAVGLLWEPVNPYVLLDFLTLPLSPVSGFGRKLARALEKQPGFGSEAWQEAVAEVLADDDGKRADKISKWLDHTRLQAGQDMPTSLLQERCGQVAQWAAGRASVEEDEGLKEALLEASAQASSFGQLAAQMGSTITEAQLARLLDDVRSEGGHEKPFPAQASGPRIVTQLADIPPSDHVVWLGVGSNHGHATPWTPDELAILDQHGLDVRPTRARAASLRADIRGLCNARSLLVVDVPTDAPTHPLWLQMHSCLQIGGSRAGSLPELEALLPSMIATQEIAPQPAQEAATIWEAGGPIPLPDTVSASSLEDQLACPLKWVLRYGLRIRPGAIASIPEGAQLKGNFGHELLEKVFLPGPPPDPDTAQKRMREHFDAFVESHAAPLAVPRKLAERKRLRRDLEDAARNLAALLHRGGYAIVGLEIKTETTVDVPGGKTPLKSYIDCVVRGPDGEAVVDFKFGGQKNKQEQLEGGRAFQLATYAHARGTRRGGYFILTKHALLTPRAGPIEGAQETLEGPDMETTWTRFADALHRASDWLSSGRVPVRPMQDPDQWDSGSTVALDPEKDEHPVCGYCEYASLCGRRSLR